MLPSDSPEDESCRGGLILRTGLWRGRRQLPRFATLGSLCLRQRLARPMFNVYSVRSASSAYIPIEEVAEFSKCELSEINQFFITGS